MGSDPRTPEQRRQDPFGMTLMSFEMMTVTVPRDRTVVFRGSPVTAFRFRLTEELANDPDFPVRDGDILIGAMGKAFESFADLMRVMNLAEDLDVARFLIERDGVEMELECDPDALEEVMDRGGQILPVLRN